MNAAPLSSNRLQRVLKVLSDRAKHTTRDLIRKANVCAVNSIVGEIRQNGIAVNCERKGNRWYYWMGEK